MFGNWQLLEAVKARGLEGKTHPVPPEPLTIRDLGETTGKSLPLKKRESLGEGLVLWGCFWNANNILIIELDNN